MANKMRLEIAARSENESFARSAVAAFALPLNPSVSALSDVKTAVSEAVTNCIVHAYRDSDLTEEEKRVVIEATTRREDGRGVLHIEIKDFGRGIDDLSKALLPFYTTLEEEERSGMGFTVMQAFMDEFDVQSEAGKGTCVTLKKIFDEDGE